MHTVFFEKSGGSEKLERVGVIMKNVLQGYQIDKATSDQYNITTIEQLKKPEIAKLFDSDGDGKANLTGCNVGWGCALVIEQHLNTYKLQDTVEHDQGRYDILLADTITRHKQGQPILYYAFVPHWSGSIFKVNQDAVWLEVSSDSIPKLQENVTEKETSIPEQNLGLTVDQVRVIANKKFLEANPAAKSLFEQITIPIEDINIELRRAHEGEDSPEDIHRHAEEWVEKNQQQFDRWVEKAKQAIP
jgi:glycine betaine/proline transport system substrate-binding protein